MKSPKFSDITINKADSLSSTHDIIEFDINKARDNHHHALETRRREIQEKIDSLEKKLQKHTLKEGMLDKIINTTYIELENLKENEFTKRGQKQSVLIKQLEALSILHDTILKYEDMIQKYHKILIDLENNKLNSFIKIESLKKEEDKADENLSEVLMALQKQIKTSSTSNESNSLLEEIEQELKENNY